MDKPKSSARNVNLDMVKIFACVAVVSLHTMRPEISPFCFVIYYLSGFAVPVFVMSGGYIMLNRTSVDWQYSLRKIVSVIKVVALWGGVLFAVNLTGDLLHRTVTISTFLYYPKLIVKGMIFQRGRLWHFWYFGALIILYASLPLLCRVRKHLARIWIVLIVAGGVIQVASYAVGTPVQERILQVFRLWTWFQYFILGGLLGKGELPALSGKVSCLGVKAHSMAFFLLTAVNLAFQIMAAKLLLHNLFAEYFYDSLLHAAWVMMLFTLVMKQRLSEKAVRLIRHLAPLTMGVYILHPLLMKITSHFINIKGIVYFIVILTASFVISLAITKIKYLNTLTKL